MTKLTLARKLPIVIVALAIMVGAGVAISAYLIAAGTAQTLSSDRLATMAKDRGTLLSQYLSSREQAVLTAARSETIQNALRDLHFGWIKLGDMPALQLIDAYVANNPNPEDQRNDLADGGTGSNYDGAHSRVHPALRALEENGGYADLYLFDTDGNCIYSVRKSSDFAATFAPGSELGKSILGGTIHDALTGDQHVELSDVGSYAPTNDAPALFMASSVIDKRGMVLGAIAVRLSVPALGQLVNGKEGLGETGEVIIVGADGVLRNDSRFTPTDDTLKTALPPAALDDALAGRPSDAWRQSYRSTDMLVQSAPLNDGKVRWQIVTIMAESEAMAPVAAMGWTMLWAALGLVAVAAGLAYLVSQTIARPITRLTSTMRGLADNQLDLAVPDDDRADEIGDMARAVTIFKTNAVKVRDMTESERLSFEQRREERSAMMADLQQAFGAVVKAATEGDFSKRVGAQFADAELNILANNVNDLVQTVDRGLSETGDVLSRLAKADVRGRVRGEYQGAFHRLKNDTNAVAESLADIIGRLRDSSNALKSATEEILSGSDDLAQRTSHQATTIAETSAAIGHLAVTVSENAQRAEEAKDVSESSAKAAQSGGDVMIQTNQAMEEIAAASTKISDVVGLIDDIAFQTNLLALNASVEAARAGDAGTRLCGGRGGSSPPGSVGCDGIQAGQGSHRAELGRGAERIEARVGRCRKDARHPWRSANLQSAHGESRSRKYQPGALP